MSDVTDELDDSPMLEEVLGDALGKLRVFHAKLAEEGEPRGLIGPRDVGIIWERHILNSAAIVPFVKEATAKKQFKTVADIGSGGGFPGIVAAACLPDHRFTLVEPMERRIEWLNECVADMELNNVTVVRARPVEMIEPLRVLLALKAGESWQWKRQERQRRQERQGSGRSRSCTGFGWQAYSGETSVCRGDVPCRGPMTKLSGWTLPLLERGGRLVALKGRSAQEEIEKLPKRSPNAVAFVHGWWMPRLVRAWNRPMCSWWIKSKLSTISVSYAHCPQLENRRKKAAEKC